jgi:SAM-dependent methyltransferase
MEQLKKAIEEMLDTDKLIEAVLSNVRQKNQKNYTKVSIKPVEIKGVLGYQFSYYYEKKVQHENLDTPSTTSKLYQLLEEHFKQGVIYTQNADYQILISKKNKVTISQKQPSKTKVDFKHNRTKKYILEEGTPVPFLIHLGVMNQEGKVLSKRYDKFKQINRFLEMIQDIAPDLPQDRRIHIVDFGCGKSYITFALYHYLHEIKKMNVQITGLDLKEDVICHCNELVDKFGYDQLRFLIGDIAQYQEQDPVDMVVTLHACNTATDAALYKAIQWNAKVILSVPCCQHELFDQVQSNDLTPMLRHGIIKERFAALATDAVRAHILEIMGYKTQILEFIDMEHTPKNLMIRAVKGACAHREKLVREYVAFKETLQITPYLEKALYEELEPLFQKYHLNKTDEA